VQDFITGALENYAEDRDRPDRVGTSRLSPFLHFGEIGPRQVAAAILSIGEQSTHPGRQRPVDAFLRELIWREFAHHLLFHFPDTADSPMDQRFSGFPWADEREALVSWQRGNTGIPLVDAGMRELWHTGWMHNRVRMVVASFLTKNLRMHWLSGARWFWDTLVDADLASNTLGWQWCAGCGADAAPYFRIFNPVLQGQKFDPDGAYIRRWLPELAGLDARDIHHPWQVDRGSLAAAGVHLGQTYPLPIVDLRLSREAALSAFASIKAAVNQNGIGESKA
jgi:deoxyribodipyrimidine photo-lyase